MEYKDCTNDGKAYQVISYAVFVLASLYAFSVEFFGIEIPDTFYYAVRYSTEGYMDVFRPFSVGIFRLVTSVFGNSILSIRLVCWSFYYGACLLGMWLANKVFPNKRIAIRYISSLSIVLIPIYETTACNGNALSSFFLVAIFAFLYQSLKYNGWWYVLLSIAIALATISRIPNSVVIAVVLIFSCIAAQDIRQIGYILLSFCGSALIVALTYLLLYGTWHNVYTAFVSALEITQDSSAADHSIGFLLNEYLHTLKDFVWHYKSLLLSIIYLFIIEEIRYFRSKREKYASIFLERIFVALFCLSLGYVLYRNLAWKETLAWDVAIALVALVLYICCTMASVAVFRNDRKMFTWSLMPIFCSLPAAAGADSGLAYMAAPLFSLLPFLSLYVYDGIRSFRHTDLSVAGIFTFLLLIFSYMYMRNSLQWFAVLLFVLTYIALWFIGRTRNKEISYLDMSVYRTFGYRWLCIACYIILAILALTSKFLMQGDERPIAECIYTFKETKLHGIHSSKQTVEWCENIMYDYHRLKAEGQEIVFYGYMSNMFAYLAGEGNITGVDFSFKPNERNMAAFKRGIETQPIIFFCPLVPGSRPLYTMETYQSMYDYLQETGYRCVNKDSYFIYYPANDN